MHGQKLLSAVLVLGLLMPPPLLAAVGVDASTTGGDNSTTTTITVPHTVTGSNLEMLCGCSVYVGSTEDCSSWTYNGVALTSLATQNNGDIRVRLFGLTAPATGTHNWVLTMSAATDVAAGCTSFTGVHQTTPLGTAATGFGTSTSPSVTVTSASGEVVFSILAVNSGSGSSPTDGGGQTQQFLKLQAGTHFSTLIADGNTAPGAASVNMTATIDNSWNWTMAGVSLKPAAGGGSTCSGGLLTRGAGAC